MSFPSAAVGLLAGVVVATGAIVAPAATANAAILDFVTPSVLSAPTSESLVRVRFPEITLRPGDALVSRPIEVVVLDGDRNPMQSLLSQNFGDNPRERIVTVRIPRLTPLPDGQHYRLLAVSDVVFTQAGSSNLQEESSDTEELIRLVGESVSGGPSRAVEISSPAVMTPPTRGQDVKVRFPPPHAGPSAGAVQSWTRHAYLLDESRDISSRIDLLQQQTTELTASEQTIRIPVLTNSKAYSLVVDSSIVYQPGGSTGLRREERSTRESVRTPVVYPQSPYALGTGSSRRVYEDDFAIIVGELGGTRGGDVPVTSRSLIHSITADPTPANCNAGTEVRRVPVALGSGSTSIAVTIPDGTAGKYLCVAQSLTTSWAPQALVSAPRTFVIVGRPANDVPVDLAVAGRQLDSALASLGEIQGRATIDQNALAAAIAAAEEARREAEAAAAQAAAQAAAAGQPAPQAASQLQGVVGRASATIEEALDTADPQATGTASLQALAAATGFDPIVTPLLDAGVTNASGVGIRVTAPATARQRKSWPTKVPVLNPVTRGGMRQYLVRMDGGTPTLAASRSGFIPRGQKGKRYWVKKPGTYGILTTFQPSTPGMVGVANFTTIRITKAKGR